MKKLFFALAFIILSSNDTFTQFDPFGLEGINVNDVKFYSGYLFAATGSGVYQRYLASPDSTWQHIGLENKKVNVIYLHSVHPVSWAITVGISPTYSANDSALIYTYDILENSWAITDSGINRSDITEIRTIDGFPDFGFLKIFAGGDGGLYRREGNSWYEEIFGTVGYFLLNVVATNLNDGSVWIGGETGYFQPYIAKSTDQGNTWTIDYLDLGGDNACNSIEFDSDTNIIYAGMEGVVIKTTDGGISWNPTTLTNTPFYFYALTFNSLHNILFAGGSTNLNSFGFYWSYDKGETWDSFPILDSLALKGISSMVIVPTNIPEDYQLYLGTFGNGVLRLQVPVSVIKENILPQTIRLYQNYPNPFNPSTTFRYSIPVQSKVTIKVYDVLGNEIAALMNEEKSIGTYELTWNASNLASGVYFYQLNAGNFNETKKMILIR